MISDSKIILCLVASLMNGVTLKEIKVYPITSPIIRYKAVIFAKLSIAKKMKDTIKIPLTIFSIGLTNFSETLAIFKRIFELISSLFSVRKKSYF